MKKENLTGKCLNKVRTLTIETYIVNCIEFENIDNPIWILSILKHDLLFKKIIFSPS